MALHYNLRECQLTLRSNDASRYPGTPLEPDQFNS